MASFALDWPTAAVILGLAALWVYHSGQNQHAACRCHDCTRIRAGHVPTPTPTVIATSAPAIQAVATPVPSTSPSPVVPVFPSAPAASLVSPCPTPPLEIVPPSLVGFAEEKAQQVQDEQDEQDRTATRILAPTPVQVQRVASSLPCAAEYNETPRRSPLQPLDTDFREVEVPYTPPSVPHPSSSASDWRAQRDTSASSYSSGPSASATASVTSSQSPVVRPFAAQASPATSTPGTSHERPSKKFELGKKRGDFHCKDCDRWYGTQNALLQHKIDSHMLKSDRSDIGRPFPKHQVQFHCPLCTKAYNTDAHLQQHLAHVHMVIEQQKNQEWSSGSGTGSTRKDAKATKPDPQVMSSPASQMKTYAERALERAARRRGEVPNGRPSTPERHFACPSCRATFSTTDELTAHAADPFAHGSQDSPHWPSLERGRQEGTEPPPPPAADDWEALAREGRNPLPPLTVTRLTANLGGIKARVGHSWADSDEEGEEASDRLPETPPHVSRHIRSNSVPWGGPDSPAASLIAVEELEVASVVSTDDWRRTHAATPPPPASPDVTFASNAALDSSPERSPRLALALDIAPEIEIQPAMSPEVVMAVLEIETLVHAEPRTAADVSPEIAKAVLKTPAKHGNDLLLLKTPARVADNSAGGFTPGFTPGASVDAAGAGESPGFSFTPTPHKFSWSRSHSHDTTPSRRGSQPQSPASPASPAPESPSRSVSPAKSWAVPLERITSTTSNASHVSNASHASASSSSIWGPHAGAGKYFRGGLVLDAPPSPANEPAPGAGAGATYSATSGKKVLPGWENWPIQAQHAPTSQSPAVSHAAAANAAMEPSKAVAKANADKENRKPAAVPQYGTITQIKKATPPPQAPQPQQQQPKPKAKPAPLTAATGPKSQASSGGKVPNPSFTVPRGGVQPIYDGWMSLDDAARHRAASPASSATNSNGTSTRGPRSKAGHKVKAERAAAAAGDNKPNGKKPKWDNGAGAGAAAKAGGSWSAPAPAPVPAAAAADDDDMYGGW